MHRRTSSPPESLEPTVGRHHQQASVVRQAVQIANRLDVGEGSPEFSLDHDVPGLAN